MLLPLLLPMLLLLLLVLDVLILLFLLHCLLNWYHSCSSAQDCPLPRLRRRGRPPKPREENSYQGGVSHKETFDEVEPRALSLSVEALA